MRRFHDQPLLSPSDLNDLLECRHLMALKLAAFERRARAQAHATAPTPRSWCATASSTSRRSSSAFEAEGRTVERIETGRSEDGAARPPSRRRLDAMRRGVEVIHQAALVGDGIGGYADFLERVERPSTLGDWSYEVSDAKLARITKTYFLVQLSAYAGAARPAAGPPARASWRCCWETASATSYRTADFAAYVRALRGHAQQTISQGLDDTYPLPCSHCGICGYRRACEQRRDGDDHLSLVAGLRRDQVARLEAAGVPTLTALAELPERHQGAAGAARHAAQAAPPGGAAAARARAPASRCYELLPYQDGYGFGLLPEPAPATSSSTSRATPTSATRGSSTCSGWAGWTTTAARRSGRSGRTTATQERRRVRGSWSTSSWAGWPTHPGSHIYHYASYEEQALKTLAMYHGTREEEVDHAAAHRARWSTCTGWCARAFASPSTATR